MHVHRLYSLARRAPLAALAPLVLSLLDTVVHTQHTYDSISLTAIPTGYEPKQRCREGERGGTSAGAVGRGLRHLGAPHDRRPAAARRGGHPSQEDGRAGVEAPQRAGSGVAR